MITNGLLLFLPQRGNPRQQDLCNGRDREQRGTGAGQHGDLRPLHEHMDAAAKSAVSAFQTRMRGYKEVHSERLMTSSALDFTNVTNWP